MYSNVAESLKSRGILPKQRSTQPRTRDQANHFYSVTTTHLFATSKTPFEAENEKYIWGCSKGQLISKANSTVFIWNKKWTNFFFYFCPEDILLRGFEPHSRKYVFVWNMMSYISHKVSLILWNVHNLFIWIKKAFQKDKLKKKILPWVGLESTILESILGQKYKNISFVFWFKWQL